MSGKPPMDHNDLAPAERLRLAQDLEAAGGEPDLSAELCAELDRRWEDHLRDSDGGEPWAQILAEMLRELDEDEADEASAA